MYIYIIYTHKIEIEVVFKIKFLKLIFCILTYLKLFSKNIKFICINSLSYSFILILSVK